MTDLDIKNNSGRRLALLSATNCVSVKKKITNVSKLRSRSPKLPTTVYEKSTPSWFSSGSWVCFTTK